MKKLILTTTGFLFLAGASFFLANVSGRDSAADDANAPHKIGVIDVEYITEKYERVKTDWEELKAEGQQLEEKLKGMVAKGTEMSNEYKTLKEGSAERKAMEEKITEYQAKYNAKQKLYKADFARDQAKMQVAIFQDIQEAVKAIATHNNITLVVKVSRTEGVNPNDMQRMTMAMQQPCVYFREQDDMSKAVVSYLNKKYLKENPDAANRVVPAGNEETTKPAKKAAAGSGKVKSAEGRKTAE